MKFISIHSLAIIFSALVFYNASGSVVEDLAANPNSCYYWDYAHIPQNVDEDFAASAEDYIRDSANHQVPSGFSSGYSSDTESNFEKLRFAREHSVALLIARENDITVPLPTLQEWLSWTETSSGSEMHKELMNELMLTVAAQGGETNFDFLNDQLFSDNIDIRESSLNALNIYGNNNLRRQQLNRIENEEIKALAEIKRANGELRDNPEELLSELKKLQRQRRMAPSASAELRDYLNPVDYDFSDEEWLRFIGYNHLIALDTTGAGEHGSFLKLNLSNLHWLGKMDQIFSRSSDLYSRQILEDAFRSGIVERNAMSLSIASKLHYLLGFSLTADEKNYLYEHLGLSEEKMLPRGRIHLIGFGRSSFRDASTSEPSEVVRQDIILGDTNKYQSEQDTGYSKHAESTKNETKNWWLWIIGFLLILSVGMMVIRRDD